MFPLIDRNRPLTKVVLVSSYWSFSELSPRFITIYLPTFYPRSCCLLHDAGCFLADIPFSPASQDMTPSRKHCLVLDGSTIEPHYVTRKGELGFTGTNLQLFDMPSIHRKHVHFPSSLHDFDSLAFHHEQITGLVKRTGRSSYGSYLPN